MSKKPVDHSDLKTISLLSEIVELNAGSNTSTVEMLREGIIRDRDLRITREMLNNYVAHFSSNVYGSDLQVNLGHYREGEAAGWFKGLHVETDSQNIAHLMAEIEWTELGVEKITKKLYKYVSSEFAFEYPHAETGELIRDVFMGAALTNIPAMKNQNQLELSEINSFANKTMFKSLLNNMKNRKHLSSDDIAFLRVQLSEAGAEEQEAHKSEVDELEKKQKQDAAEAEAAEKAKQAEAEKKLNDLKVGTVSLSEHLALKAKVERQELSTSFDQNFCLSESHEVGFREESKGEVVDFLLSLSENQRESFAKLMPKLAAVKFGEIGSAKSGSSKNQELSEEAKQAKVVELATKYTGEGMEIRDAQRKAYKEVYN